MNPAIKIAKIALSALKRGKNRIFSHFSKFFCRKVWKLKKSAYLCNPKQQEWVTNAEIAQLVEHNLAKVRVASSSLVFRSKKSAEMLTFVLKSLPDEVSIYSVVLLQRRLFCLYIDPVGLNVKFGNDAIFSW